MERTLLVALLATENSTFLSVPAESWSAWGVWITCVVYVGLARIAYVQYRESQRLRIEQRGQVREERKIRIAEQAESRKAESDIRTQLQRAELRPFVMVDIDTSRRSLFALKVENIGRTAATEVTVTLDRRIESASLRPDQLEWQENPMFAGDGAMLAPGQCLSFPFDLTEDRFRSDQATRVAGTKRYQSHDGQDRYEERFDIDLNVFKNALLSQPGLRELIKEVAEIRKALPGRK